MIICDPKSELYETTSQYLREQEYTVRVFNLVSPEHSDSWACLSEIEGDELMTQLWFCMWGRVLPATKEAAKNQNEDISFQSEAEDLLGQENLETIAHTISVFRKGQ